MNTRREFIRSTVLGAAAIGVSPLLLGSGAPGGGEDSRFAPPAFPPEPNGVGDVFDLVRPLGPIILASDRGCPMVKDALSGGPASQVRLVKGEGAWTKGGLVVGGGEAILGVPSLPVLGNRSNYARVDFASDSPLSTVELRLVTTDHPTQGKMLSPLRARLSGGAFVLLSLTDEVLAGDPSRVVFTPRPGEWHTMELITFQKSVHARISGCGTVLRLPDRLRFIPGSPGLRLAPAPNARVCARDWLVTAIGPTSPLLGAIGDSITAGLQFGPEVDDYVHRVTRALGQEFVLNTGSGGATTGIDRARFRYEITPFRPRLVWIESGSNDIAKGLHAAQIYENLAAMAAQINWGGRAVFSTVLPRKDFGPAAWAERGRLNELIRASGFPFVERAKPCETPGNKERMRPDYDSGDGTHPNARGAAAIADAAVAVFRQFAS
jgi:lysophospholipase L1-like esterase